MNQYFFPGEGREGYPRRSFAKLDQVEPPNLEEAGEIMFAFDSVDAEWRGFEHGQLLSLEPDEESELQRRAFWKRRFGPPGERDIDSRDPFDDLPIYRIEITLARDDPWAKNLIASAGRWVEIELNDAQGREVDVFGGLFMPPVPAKMAHPPRPAPESPMLERLFDMGDWPDTTVDELNIVLSERCSIEQLLVT